MRYSVTHETSYQYAGAVASSMQLAHLRPRSTHWQTIIRHSLSVQPEPTECTPGQDYFGNSLYRFAIHEPHESLKVRAESEVVVLPAFEPQARSSVAWEAACQTVRTPKGTIDIEVEVFRTGSRRAPLIPEAARYASASFAAGRDWFEAVCDLNNRIHADFTYDPTATTIHTRVVDLLVSRRGVCQDFAHLMVSGLRSLGLPARYVSGYILTRSIAGQPRLVGADASHAWVASYCPGIGWVAFDPTNAKLAGTEFITLAWGRDFDDVTPLRGVVLGTADQQLSVAVTVEPLPNS